MVVRILRPEIASQYTSVRQQIAPRVQALHLLLCTFDKSHKSVHFGSRSGRDFLITIQRILERYKVLERVALRVPPLQLVGFLVKKKAELTHLAPVKTLCHALQTCDTIIAFYSLGGLFRSLCPAACRIVYCGQTVQDRPIVCVEVEYEYGDDIFIGTIFDPLGRPKRNLGLELRCHKFTLQLRRNSGS